VLLERNDAPVRYEPVLTSTCPSEYLQSPAVSTARSAHRHQRTQEWESATRFAVFAAAVGVFICEVLIPARTTGAEELVLGEIVTATSHGKTQQPERAAVAPSASPDTASAILEMRPARRSLRDKAREEMSEFERKYPW
jgi:hypothetical protein